MNKFEETDLTKKFVAALQITKKTLTTKYNSGLIEKSEIDLLNDIESLIKRINVEKLDVSLVSREY